MCSSLAKKHFTIEEDWETFYAHWNAVINSITEEEYEVQLRRFTMEQPIFRLHIVWKTGC